MILFRIFRKSEKFKAYSSENFLKIGLQSKNLVIKNIWILAFIHKKIANFIKEECEFHQKIAKWAYTPTMDHKKCKFHHQVEKKTNFVKESPKKLQISLKDQGKNTKRSLKNKFCQRLWKKHKIHQKLH